jgi:heterodisulfide reductase subunit A
MEDETFGAVLMATGGQASTPNEYLYGTDERVLTQKELEKKLSTGQANPSWRSVVMIQCVGSRDEQHPWCSRICCSHAVKNALKLKEQSPDTEVYVLYRDIRTYGFMEIAYQQAREAGVVFLRYDLPDKPEVGGTESGRLQILTSEPILGDKVSIEADLLVLSSGIEARDNTRLAELMELPIGDDGFFKESHPKMRPMDFTRAGVYMAGLANSPRHIFESITQAEGAAVRVAALLAAKVQEAKQTRVSMNPRQCSFCGLCVENCDYGARIMEEEKQVAEVIVSLCQGCGVCAMVCPNKTTQQNTFSQKQIMAAIDAAVSS